MDPYSALQYALFLVIVTALVQPLGEYLERVFSRKTTALDRVCLPLERLIYRITKVDPNVEMTSSEYTTCFVFFGLAGTILLYFILRVQTVLPWFFPQYQTTPAFTRLGSEYGDQFLDDDDLAGLQRGRHDELLQPNGWPLRSELPGRRCRAGNWHRVYSRFGEATLRNAREFLGRSDTGPALDSFAWSTNRRHVSRVAGSSDELPRLRRS